MKSRWSWRGCARCQWKRDGEGNCLLPVCMKSIYSGGNSGMRSRAQTVEFLRSYQIQLHEARLVSEQLRELEEVITRVTPYLGQGCR